MDSEIFEKLPPTKLFFRLAIPSMITMMFGALYQQLVSLGLSGTFLDPARKHPVCTP